MRKLLYLFALMSITGCGILYPSMMLKTPRNYQFSPADTATTSPEYKISINDFLSFRLYSNDGLKLIDFTNTGDNNNGGGSSAAMYSQTNAIDYVVNTDGRVKLPVIGYTSLVGMTIAEATEFLEKKYALYYIKPFIVIKVTNRRVIVFPGDPGTAKVIPLLNNNITLIEALALTGGITESGKARQVKLIRGNPDKPQVFLIDLSTIYGIKAGSMILQANDIIYVTPQRRFGEQLLERITPSISLITSLTSLFVTIILVKSYANSK